MSLINDFPPDLNTPFNHSVAFLLRVVDDRRDIYFIEQLKHCDFYCELSRHEKSSLFILLDEYGYFDRPDSSAGVTGETLDQDAIDRFLANLKRLIEQGGAV